MTKTKFIFSAFLIVAALAGCARQGQNTYNYSEVGKSAAVSFGTIIAMREVDIIGQNSGIGSAVGGAAGMGAGSYAGSGTGHMWGAGIGLLAGAVIGGLAEQAASNRKGLEYTVTLESGVTLTITQDKPDTSKNEHLFQMGERVIVQNAGGFQRVLPTGHLPTEVKRPQGIKVVD